MHQSHSSETIYDAIERVIPRPRELPHLPGDPLVPFRDEPLGRELGGELLIAPINER